MFVRRSPEVVVPQLPVREVLAKPIEYVDPIRFNPGANLLSEVIQENQFSPRKKLRRVRRDSLSKSYVNKGYGSCWQCRKGAPPEQHNCWRRRVISSDSEPQSIKNITRRKELKLYHLKKIEFF